ncbi:hypothetical protein TNCV_3175791 [Trichonephila clavipes]|nr:hypothetical protein TNCV_3175791 [Trichonephila clavipes]
MLSSRPGAIYQQDNARPHIARLSQQCFHRPTMARQVTRSFANRDVWEGNCSRPEIQGELTAQMQRGRIFHRGFVEWAQNEIAVVPDFHKRILFSDEAHFWLNGYVNKQNCRIWSEANPQVYVETPLHPEKLTVWYALWAGGILVKKR